MQKQCTRCSEVKEIQEFPRKGYSAKGEIKYSGHCKICQRGFGKLHYQKNKQYYYDKAKRNDISTVERNRIAVQRFKYDQGCSQCNEKDPRCLDFHHIDSSTKLNCVSVFMRDRCTQKLWDEVAKCEVLCANCHRKLHVKLAIDLPS